MPIPHISPRPKTPFRSVSIRIDPATEEAMAILDNRLEGFNLSHFCRRAIQHLASQHGFQPPQPQPDADRLP